MTDRSATNDDALIRLARRLAHGGYRFVTPTPATHARVNARAGNEVAHDAAGVFGWSRPFRPDALDPEILKLGREANIFVEGGELLRSTLRLSTLGDHLFWHSAFPTKNADAVFFGPDTYRFAAAIEVALPGLRGPVHRAVDIGCGAGPGGILMAEAFPEAEVLLVDINEAALDLARVNAELARTPNATPLRSDLLSAANGPFDLIVSNPPYLNDPLARAYRHGGGRYGEALSLRILDASLAALAPGGTLLLYTGVATVGGRDPFREEVEAKLADATRASAKLTGDSFVSAYRELDPDVFGEELDSPAYADADRIAAILLTVTKRT